MTCTRIAAVLLLAATAAAQAPKAGTPAFDLEFFGVHRGGAKWRPEHTLDIYREVVARWPQALLECDARLTLDGVVVLHHDETVDRTTDGTGPIADLTLAEVRTLDAGYKFTTDGGATYPYRAKGLKIATLDELLAAFPTSPILIEPKDQPGVVPAVVELIRKHRAEKRVLLASFQPAMMEEVKRLLPEAATCFSTTSGMRLVAALRNGDWQAYTPDDHVLALGVRMLRQHKLTAQEIAALRHKGIQTLLYDVDDEPEMDAALALGVDAVLTDRPELLAEFLARRQQQPALTTH